MCKLLSKQCFHTQVNSTVWNCRRFSKDILEAILEVDNRPVVVFQMLYEIFSLKDILKAILEVDNRPVVVFQMLYEIFSLVLLHIFRFLEYF